MRQHSPIAQSLTATLSPRSAIFSLPSPVKYSHLPPLRVSCLNVSTALIRQPLLPERANRQFMHLSMRCLPSTPDPLRVIQECGVTCASISARLKRESIWAASLTSPAAPAHPYHS